MTYEEMDWHAEAKRVARAFGVVGGYDFIEDSDGQSRRLTRPMNWLAVLRARLLNIAARYWQKAPYRLPTKEGLYLSVSYLLNPDIFRKVFALSDSEVVFKRVGDTGLRFDRHGATLFTPPYQNIYAHQMAKGLFHLDLLTLEVEAALNVSISSHQKMEWALEYEAQYKFDNSL